MHAQLSSTWLFCLKKHLNSQRKCKNGSMPTLHAPPKSGFDANLWGKKWCKRRVRAAWSKFVKLYMNMILALDKCSDFCFNKTLLCAQYLRPVYPLYLCSALPHCTCYKLQPHLPPPPPPSKKKRGTKKRERLMNETCHWYIDLKKYAIIEAGSMINEVI